MTSQSRLLSTDTICALATAPGPGGIAVIRVSGPDSLAIADRLFHGKQKPSLRPGQTICHGWITDPDKRLPVDEVLLSVFRRSRSYTGEDMVEVSCHGGAAVADSILGLLARHGARPASRGEFTRRAVLNGKLDLAQAEAILDLIEARSETARTRAVRQLAGVFSRRIERLAESLRDARVELTALLEFGEDLPRRALPDNDRRLGRVAAEIAALRRQAEQAPIVRDGALVAIVGSPNVGKSSLFNRLVGEERALVTEAPGTTRDALEAGLVLNGMPVRLFDTAGWQMQRPSSEASSARSPVHCSPAAELDALGAKRARYVAEQADALLVVLDSSRRLTDLDRQIVAAMQDKPRVLAVNKTDLKPWTVRLGRLTTNGTPRVRVSAKTGAGLSRLKQAIAGLFAGEGRDSDFLGTRRHLDNLQAAGEAIAAARASPVLDVRVSETQRAEAALEDLLGKTPSEAVLDEVFRRFCVGK